MRSSDEVQLRIRLTFIGRSKREGERERKREKARERERERETHSGNIHKRLKTLITSVPAFTLGDQ